MGYDKEKEKRELVELDRAIKAFYTGEMSTEDFVLKYWNDSWDSLIAYVQQSGFNMRNGKIPQALINKKEQYEQGVVEYYRRYSMSMEIGNRYFEEIDKQDIETCIKYLVGTEQFSSKSMKETIRQYLSGKIPEIKETPISKSIPKKDRPVVPDWYIPWKKGPHVNRNVRQFYNGQLSTKSFVQRFAGTWEELLETLVAVGKVQSKDDIVQKVLDKREEFETAVIQSFGEEYCEMTQISVNGQHIHPTIEDVNEAVKFMRQNGIGIGKSTITQTLTKYLRGEIEVQQASEELEDLPQEELETDIQQTEAPQVDFEEAQTEFPQEDLEQVDVPTTDMRQEDTSEKDTLDLRPMREQRTKCQMLETRLQQMQGDLDSNKARLQEMQSLLGQPGMEITKIQELATEILEIAQRIEEEQKVIDGLDVERIAGEQQLKDMKAAAIAEIENI